MMALLVSLILLMGIVPFAASRFHASQVSVEVVATDPIITPAPTVVDDIGTLHRDFAAEVLGRQESIDPVELANILLTAFPQSLREIAATNVPQVSRILWSEFLDNNTPSWFAALPTEIQGYLSGQFGPSSKGPQTTASFGTDSSTVTTSTPIQATVVQTTLVTVGSSGSSPSASNVAEAPTAASSSDLSTAQKIGIGVGVPLGIAVVAAGLLFCFLCRRRRSKSRQNTLESSRGQNIDERVPTPAFISSSNVSMGERRRDGGEADALLPMPASRKPTRNTPFPDGMEGNGYDTYANNRQTYDLYKNDNPYVLPTTSKDPLRSPLSSSNGYPGHVTEPSAGAVSWRSRAGTRTSRNSRASLSSLNLHPVPEVPENSGENHHNRGGGVLSASPVVGRSPGTISNHPKSGSNSNQNAAHMMAGGSSGILPRKSLSPPESDMGTHPALRSIDHAPPKSTARDSLGPFSDSYGYGPYGDDYSHGQIDENSALNPANGVSSASMGTKPPGFGVHGGEWPLVGELVNSHSNDGVYGRGSKPVNRNFEGNNGNIAPMTFKRGSETRPNWHQMYEGT